MDIGGLTGEISLEDKLSSTITLMTMKVQKFADDFSSSMSQVEGGSKNLDNLKSAAEETGGAFGFFGGILNEVFGSWPAKIAEGVLLRDMVHALIREVKAGAEQFAMTGSEVNDVQAGFDRLAGGVSNATNIISAMRAGVVGTVTDFELMKEANKLLQAGVKGTAADFGSLSEAGRILSREGMGPLSTIMAQIDRAMMTGNTARLSRIGLTVDVAKAEKELADSLHTTVAQLSPLGVLEAKRIATLEATRNLVASAGVQETSLAEKITQVRVAISNWSNELASAIAASPAVNTAFDTIKKAFSDAFGSDSQTLLQKVVFWVNYLAEKVTQYGPGIIQTVAEIRTKIIELWHEVEQAWDMVPDWFKHIAETAGLAAIAVGLTNEVLQTTGGNDVLTSLANLAQIWSVVGSSVVGATTAVKEFGVMSAIVFRTGGISAILSEIGIAAQAAGAGIAAFMGSTLGIGALFVALGVAIAGVVTAFVDLFQAIRDGKNIWDYLFHARSEDELDWLSKAVRHALPDWMVFNKTLSETANKLQDLGVTGPTYTGALDHALKELASNSGNTGTQIRDVATAVSVLAEAGKLPTPILRQVAAALKASGVSAGDLPPILQNVVTAMDRVGTALKPDLVKDSSAKVAAEIVAMQSKIEKSWDEYNVIVAKSQGDSFAAQDVATVKWYDQQYEMMAKDYAKKGYLHEHAYDIKDAVDATYGAKLDASAEAHAKHEADIAAQLGKLWGEYYVLIDKADLNSVQGKIDNETKLYNSEIANLNKTVKDEEEHNALFEVMQKVHLAKVGNIKTDAATAATARLMVEDAKLNDFVMKNSMSTTAYQITKIWEDVDAQIAADYMAGRADERLNETRRVYAQKQTDMINMTYDTLVARLDQQGILTRKQLDDQAFKFKLTYDQMLESGLYTAEELGKAWQKAFDAAHPALLSFENSLTTITNAMTQLAQTSGGTFGGIAKEIGGMFASANLAMKSMTQLSSSIAQYKASSAGGYDVYGQQSGGGQYDQYGNFKPEDTAGKYGAVAGGTLAVAGGVAAIGSATDPSQHGKVASIAGGALSGATTGAMIGTYMVPGLGTAAGAAIGAAVGAIVGWWRSRDKMKEGLAQIGNEWGVELSKDFLDKIKSETEDNFNGSEVAAMTNHIKDVIAAAGGLTTGNFTMYAGHLRDTFALIGQNLLSVGQATKIIDENFADFAKVGTSGAGVLNKAMREMIDLDTQYGTNSKAVSDYVAGQLTNSQKGFAQALGVTADAYRALPLAKTQEDYDNLQKVIDITGIHSQATASAVASSLVGIVAANMQAGMSFADAIKNIGPAVTDLQTQLAATGMSGGEAFQFISEEVLLANDAIAGPALAAVEGYTAGMVGLANAGMLNQDTFEGLASQIGSTEAALESQGHTSKSVEVAMSKDLQSIWELQQQYGYTLDANTQALVDQAAADGIVGEAHKSSTQQMIDASNKMLDVLTAMATFMGVQLPKAAEAGAAGVTTAFENTHPVITVGFDTSGAPSGAMIDTLSSPQYAATGAVIQQPEYLEAGGNVLPFTPKGTDIAPVMATPGERMLSVAQNRDYEAEGGGKQPSNQAVVDAVNALRGDLNSKFPRALARAVGTELVGMRVAS
jgi:hypothetical protein